MNSKIHIVCALLFAAVAYTTSAQTPVEETLRRADTQFDLYAYNTALNTYNEALKTDPNNSYALGRKADCYFQLNRPSEALPFYDRAVTLGQKDAEIMFRYAQALMQTGDYAGAKRWFNQYATINPAAGQHYAAMCDYANTLAQRGGMFTAKNEALNTPSADFAPGFWGNRVIYSSSRRDIQRKSPKGESGAGSNELFITQRNLEDGMLQRPAHLLADLQKSAYFNEGPASYSAGGKKVAFCHNKFVDGTRQIASKGIEMSLYIADVDETGKWVNPKAFPYNSTDYAVGFPWLSNDGTALYFASNMSGGMGGWDLYVSNYNAVSQSWSAPSNLGPTVNTPGNEITPFIEGTDLYFASDWHNGLGGLDVFKADFKNNYANNVVNLGAGVNSARDDYGFIYDSKNGTGYFTSNRPDGKGNEDIWQIGRGRDEFSIVVNDQYKQPIADAEIDFTSCGASVMRTDAAGRYEFATTKGQANCIVTIRKAGYSPATIRISSEGEHNLVIALASNASASGTTTAPATYSATATTGVAGIGTEALGSVVDQDTRDPLYSVKVSALPWPSGTPVETYSNYSGQYTLQLDPSRAYTITFTKAGYGDMSSNIFSGAAGTQTTIAQMGMIRPITSVATATPNTTEVLKQRGGDPVATPSYTPPATPPAYTPVTHSTGTAPMTPVGTPAKTIDGYAIQLAATPKDATIPDVQQLDELTTYGNLYNSTEGNLTKTRLGVFATKAEAEAVLKKVKTSKKDAFIVEEKKVDPALAAAYSDPNTGVAAVTHSFKAPETDKQTLVAPVLTSVPATQFAIQVKSIDQKEAVILNQYTELSQFGSLYTRSENGVTRLRVGVWANQADAETALNLIMSKGYKESVVVVEKMGTDIPAAPSVYETPAGVPPVTSPVTTPATTPPSSLSPVANPGTSAIPSYTPPSATAQGALPDLLAPVTHSTKGASSSMVPVNAPTLGTGTTPVAYEQFMVRICTLTGDPTKFEVQKAEQAGGKVDARQMPNGSIVMLLTNMKDYDSAVTAKNKLHILGFPDAFVVKEVNRDGLLRRIGL